MGRAVQGLRESLTGDSVSVSNRTRFGVRSDIVKRRRSGIAEGEKSVGDEGRNGLNGSDDWFRQESCELS